MANDTYKSKYTGKQIDEQLDKIKNLSKTDIDLDKVENVRQASKTDFDNHVSASELPHADKSVTTKKLADKAVTNDKIADEVFNGISNTYEKTVNKVTALSSSSTDTQYPSAKAVYDELEAKQDKLDPQKIPVSADNITTPKTGDMRFKLGDSMTYGIELYTTQWDKLSVDYAIQAYNATIAQRALFDANGIPIAEAYQKITEAESTYEPKSTVTDTENASETLVKNFIFNFGERTAITITLPAAVSNDYISGFTFVSGATPTSLTMPTEIKFSGVDCFDGSFTPTANKTYQVIISRVANEFWGDVDARDYEAPTEETT